MLLATHIRTGKVYEGHIQGVFFISNEIGSKEHPATRDKDGFFEWRNWTEYDYEFNLN